MMILDDSSTRPSIPLRAPQGVTCWAALAVVLMAAQTGSADAAVGANAAVPAPVQLDVIAQDLAQSAAEANQAPATPTPSPSPSPAPAVQDQSGKAPGGAGTDVTNKAPTKPVAPKATAGKALPAAATAAKDTAKPADPKAAESKAAAPKTAAAPRGARPAQADAAIQATARREIAAATRRLLYWRSIYRARYRAPGSDVAQLQRERTRDWWGRHFVLILGVGY